LKRVKRLRIDAAAYSRRAAPAELWRVLTRQSPCGRSAAYFRTVFTQEATASLTLSLPEQVLGTASGLLLHLPTDYRQRMLEIDPLESRLEIALLELRERLARSSRLEASSPKPH
jgi:hypothetical protein